MPSLNQCNFIGNAADAPEVRAFNDGNKIATFRIAVSERFTDRNGEQKENTEWITCVCNNNKLAEVAEKFVTKGSSLFVTGKYRTRQWQDQQGQKRFSTEINVLNFQLLGQKPQTAQPQAAPVAPPQRPRPQAPVPPAPQYQAPPVQPQYPVNNDPSYFQPQNDDMPF